MKKLLLATFVPMTLLLLSISGNAGVFIQNNTYSTLQVIFTKAENVPSNYKDYKLKIFGVSVPGYFEVAPNQKDLLALDFSAPVSIKLSTGISWKNLDSLGSPPFSEQIALEKKNPVRTEQYPLLIIGTKNLGLSWDIKLQWVSKAEAEKMERTSHYNR